MSVRLKAPLSALALALVALTACTDVNRQSPPDEVVLAAFITPTPAAPRAVLPLPSDLALRGAPQQLPGVQREVLFAFIAGGGFPGDQTITIPLRRQVRNAETRAYEPSAEPPGEIDESTVTRRTVAIVRLDDQTVLEPQYVGQRIDPSNADIRQLLIRAKDGIPAGRYVVAVRGGASGVKTRAGLPIGPDTPIMLIAPNKDLSNPENQPPSGLAPEQITALEGLRSLFRLPLQWQRLGNGTDDTPQQCIAAYAGQFPPAAFPEKTCWQPTGPSTSLTPAFSAVDKVFPHGQLASIQTFEISAPAVVVDAAAGIVPFPSDFLMGANGRVAPIPSLGEPLSTALTSLDGFSTTSLQLIPLSGPVDATTITPENVLLFDLGTVAAPLAEPALVTALGGGSDPNYLVQPPSLVRTVGPAKVSTSIGLQPAVPVDSPATRPIYLPAETPAAYLPPLQEKHRYLVIVTDGVKDLSQPTPKSLARGTIGTLLLDVDTPLFADGQSNVPGVSAGQAAALQQLKGLLSLVVPGIEANTGKKVVMGYTITMQSVRDVSSTLGVLAAGIDQRAAAEETPATVFVSGPVDPNSDPENDIPVTGFPNVQRILNGTVTSLQLMDPATGGLSATTIGAVAPLLPNGQPNGSWTLETVTNAAVAVPVTVAIPQVPVTCTTEAPCARPLVLFHHGINGGRLQMLGAVNDLAAKGFVVAAVDAPFHGDRAVCLTSADCAGGVACVADPTNQLRPATCQGDAPLAVDAITRVPVASGNYFISENFFRIRDAIRQDVFDQSAAIQALARPGATDPIAVALRAKGVTVDPAQVYWTGISLGNIIGTSVVASNPRISRAGLNVPGGTLTDIFTQSPSFRDEVGSLLGGLIPGFTFDRVDPTNAAFDPAIAQRYAQTLIVAKWVLDPADPINYASHVRDHDAVVYGQMVREDAVIPNPFNKLLFEVGDIPYNEYVVAAGAVTDDANGTRGQKLHGLLLFPNALGAPVRSDLADFLETGTPTSGEVALPLQ